MQAHLIALCMRVSHSYWAPRHCTIVDQSIDRPVACRVPTQKYIYLLCVATYTHKLPPSCRPYTHSSGLLIVSPLLKQTIYCLACAIIHTTSAFLPTLRRRTRQQRRANRSRSRSFAIANSEKKKPADVCQRQRVCAIVCGVYECVHARLGNILRDLVLLNANDDGGSRPAHTPVIFNGPTCATRIPFTVDRLTTTVYFCCCAPHTLTPSRHPTFIHCTVSSVFEDCRAYLNFVVNAASVLTDLRARVWLRCACPSVRVFKIFLSIIFLRNNQLVVFVCACVCLVWTWSNKVHKYCQHSWSSCNWKLNWKRGGKDNDFVWTDSVNSHYCKQITPASHPQLFMLRMRMYATCVGVRGDLQMCTLNRTQVYWRLQALQPEQ